MKSPKRSCGGSVRNPLLYLYAHYYVVNGVRQAGCQVMVGWQNNDPRGVLNGVPSHHEDV